MPALRPESVIRLGRTGISDSMAPRSSSSLTQSSRAQGTAADPEASRGSGGVHAWVRALSAVVRDHRRNCPAIIVWSDLFPPDAGWTGWEAVQNHQVQEHGPRR